VRGFAHVCDRRRLQWRLHAGGGHARGVVAQQWGKEGGGSLLGIVIILAQAVRASDVNWPGA
jgi:hypothetical protein